MELRRGFKSEAAALAKEVRGELGLDPLDGLNPLQLARFLDISIVPLSDMAVSLPGAQHFLAAEQDAFSALTVFDGHRRMIVHNDSHSGARQNSNLAHELAHALLRHEPAEALDTNTECRDWNDTKEKEAEWLGGELLVTSDMALAVARGQLTRQQAQQRFGVSDKMLSWRINKTGAIRRVERERHTRNASWRNPRRSPVG